MAETESDVVGVVRDYVAQLDRFEISVLPEACRPTHKFCDGIDVMEYAFALARQSCKDATVAEGQELILKLATFCSQASFRLSQITARTNDDEETTGSNKPT